MLVASIMNGPVERLAYVFVLGYMLKNMLSVDYRAFVSEKKTGSAKQVALKIELPAKTLYFVPCNQTILGTSI